MKFEHLIAYDAKMTYLLQEGHKVLGQGQTKVTCKKIFTTITSELVEGR